MRSIALTLLLGCGAIACEGPAGEVSVVLEIAPGAEDDAATVESLAVFVRDFAEPAPDRFDVPIGADAAPRLFGGAEKERRLAASVPPGNPFYVDVWGCRVAEACIITDVVLRGCETVLWPDNTTTLELAIVLYPVTAAQARRCPPDPPSAP